jgi:hypothetical protein
MMFPKRSPQGMQQADARLLDPAASADPQHRAELERSGFVVRPHTAGATAKAAHDAWVLGRSLARASQNVDAGLQAAERLQLDYGNDLTRYGIALGDRWASARPARHATP